MGDLDSLKGKTVFVTGATGFIGSHLMNRLSKEESIQLIGLTRKPKNKTNNILWVTASLDNLCQATWRLAKIEKIDLVFHLAAFIPKRNNDPGNVERIYQDNILGTRTLLENLPSLPEKVIFSSSVDVYAPLFHGSILDESSSLNPMSLYGVSKLFCEKLLRVYAQREGYGYVILRYGHTFGPGEGAYQKLIPQTIKALIQRESPILYGDGSAERDFLYVEDVVESTLRAAISEQREIEPINIVRGVSSSVDDIVKTIVEIMGGGTIQYLKDQPAGYSLRFDNKRMFEVLGKWNFVQLEEGLKQEIRYFKGA